MQILIGFLPPSHLRGVISTLGARFLARRGRVLVPQHCAGPVFFSYSSPGPLLALLSPVPSVVQRSTGVRAGTPKGPRPSSLGYLIDDARTIPSLETGTTYASHVHHRNSRLPLREISAHSVG